MAAVRPSPEVPPIYSWILSTRVKGLVLVKAWTLHRAAVRSQSHSQMVTGAISFPLVPFSSSAQRPLSCTAFC